MSTCAIMICVSPSAEDDCARKPCKNDGTCTDDVNKFICSCLQGYEGSTCEIGLLDYYDVFINNLIVWIMI